MLSLSAWIAPLARINAQSFDVVPGLPSGQPLQRFAVLNRPMFECDGVGSPKSAIILFSFESDSTRRLTAYLRNTGGHPATALHSAIRGATKGVIGEPPNVILDVEP